MPGNEQYPGAKRRPGSKKGPTKGSGGQRRKVALANVLASDFDVLILDEPTNHLDNAML